MSRNLVLLVLGAVAAVVAAVLGWTEFTDGTALMFVFGWGAVALLAASQVP